MSENIKNTKEIEEINAATDYTVDYILAKLAEIQQQTEYLNQSITELSKVHSGGPEDIGAAEKAKALADVVRCRETTNQQLIKFYEKMYDELMKSRNPYISEAQELLDFMKETSMKEYSGHMYDSVINPLLAAFQTKLTNG